MRRAGILFISAFVAALILVSCSKVKRKPGWEFAPQMYEPIAYNPDQPNPVFADGRTAQLPPEGTVRAKDQFYFPFNAHDSSFTAAGQAFTTNPLAGEKGALAEGRALYLAYCSHCHGETGQGDGGVVVNGNYPAPPPKFNDATGLRARTGAPITEYTPGMIYHTITYGYNVMGPHASLVTPEERWKITLYVQELQKL